MRVKSIGIIGFGSFGRLAAELIGRFAPRVTVKVYARARARDHKTFFSLEEVCKTDAVILAVPIRQIESVLKQILPLIEPHTVLVDIATVKVHTERLLKRYARGRRYVASHPMFGPESYEKSDRDVAGFRIVITAHSLPEAEYASLCAFLKKCRFDVVEMTARRHDRHLAETLFLTHFIGRTVAEAGFVRTDIDTVSFRFLMDAVESVKNDSALFMDVFRFNPYCENTLTKLERAESNIHALLRKAMREEEWRP